ncbi:unnamed protein product [Closterium sp. Naga37s-1]|nr:unnamed protein product [Closterium sp. Naga37s-1]
MAHSTRFVVLAALLAALLLALLPAHAAPSAVDLCALTGLPPKKPVVPPHRCPAAAELSCCADCADTNRALQLVSSTLDDVAQRIDPNIPGSGIIDLSPMVRFRTAPRVATPPPSPRPPPHLPPSPPISSPLPRSTLPPQFFPFLCVAPDHFAHTCLGPSFLLPRVPSPLAVQGVAMNQLIPDVQNMMVYVTNYVSNFMGIQNFNIAIGTRPCLTGAAAAPTYPPCCDPLAVDPKCPAGAVDKVAYAPYINRTIDSATCMAGSPQSAPAPSPPRDAPAPPAPGAAAPAPSLISPGAPAPSVIAPGAPAPAPPAPTAGVPGAPSPPASPSPTPASPSFPPPPPKAGAGSAASVMSVVALAVGAAVFV